MSEEISFYTDMMIVEAVIGNPTLLKKADSSGLMSGLIEKIKDYVSAHIDPNNRTASIINILAPGALSMAFKSMGLGWLGVLLGMATSVFHIDVAGILQSIWTKIKDMIGGDKQVSSSQIDSAVQSSVQSNLGPDTEIQKSNFNQKLRNAKLVRISMENFDKQNLSLMIKSAGSFGTKSGTVSILTQVLSWIFKVALAAAGFMVAGDVVNKFVGRPNALDHSYQAGKETAESTTTQNQSRSTQTKFPLKGDSPIPFMLPIQNTPENIDNIIINFAKSVYSGLDGKEEAIKATPGFMAVQDKIKEYNSSSPGDNAVYFPKEFSSKKALVDLFIDDVAKAS